MLELNQVRKSFCKWIHLKDPYIIDAILGWVVANSLERDAMNLYLIGPPSSGKTESLRSLNGHPKIYPLSSLTPQTLVSGSPKIPPDQVPAKGCNDGRAQRFHNGLGAKE